MAPILLGRHKSYLLGGISRQRQGFPRRERLFMYSTGGGPGEVRMGCQVSTEESTEWWGRWQDLVGASLIWALIMLIEHG